jgi:hypothetical protein
MRNSDGWRRSAALHNHFALAKPTPPWWPLEEPREPEELKPREKTRGPKDDARKAKRPARGRTNESPERR